MTSSERRSLMAERGNSVVRLQVESTPYASARPNRRSALARNSANLAGRGTSSLLCIAIVGGATRRLLTSAPRYQPYCFLGRLKIARGIAKHPHRHLPETRGDQQWPQR